jgi:mannose-6-phosphate isomerase
MSLYPLKFTPIFKERIWGGNRLKTVLNKNIPSGKHIGESWELSAVEDNISVVENGNLAGNDLAELIEIYMGELVGDKIFESFGHEFPLLIKFIDANQDLSIQVHPDDKMAAERHHARGKTEMWVALDAEPHTKLISGFNRATSQKELLEKLENKTVAELFHHEDVKKGDVFFVPAGRVHAICAGNLIAEIQQTSDITYRLFDYNRTDENGNERELHLKEALDVIDYSKVENPKVKYLSDENKPVELASCNYFTTNLLSINQTMARDFYGLDSFVILIGMEGECMISGKGFDPEKISKGETVLIPAALNSLEIKPLNAKAELLEVYIA